MQALEAIASRSSKLISLRLWHVSESEFVWRNAALRAWVLLFVDHIAAKQIIAPCTE